MTDSYRANWRAPMPLAVKAAVWLMLVQAATGVILLIVRTPGTSRSSIRRRLERQRPRLSSSAINFETNTFAVIGIVSAVIGVIITLLFAWWIGQGKNWARIVTWVFCGLGVASLGLLFTRSGAAWALTIVNAVEGIAVASLLFIGGRDGFFRDDPSIPTNQPEEGKARTP